MELTQAIVSRRSIRKWGPKAVPKDAVLKLIEAARWAPSGGNRQPWRFVVVQDPALIRLIKMFAQGIFGDPPLIIAVSVEKGTGVEARPRRFTTKLIDIGMAAQNILLTAESLGLGSCAIRGINEEAVRELLEIPPTFQVVLLINIGYLDETPKPPPKKLLEEIAYSELYGLELSVGGET